MVNIYTDKHNEYMEKIVNELNRQNPRIKHIPNCCYNPKEGRIALTRNEYFEYDIMGFPKTDSGIDEQHPCFFLEFTNSKYFRRKKFVYEVIRWVWFRKLLTICERLENPKQQPFYQVWKAPTANKNYHKLLDIGLIHKSFNVIVCTPEEFESKKLGSFKIYHSIQWS